MNKKEPVRIVLANGHDAYRLALRTWLAAETDFDVVGETRSGEEAVRLAEELQPDVVILDVVLPGLNGIQATRRILELAPSVRVVALSLHDDQGIVLAMLEAGASGYILKDDDRASLRDGIRAVAAGRKFLSPRLRKFGPGQP